jgi:threonine dehydrogenase-like Zn-dependent dehydrogenase
VHPDVGAACRGAPGARQRHHPGKVFDLTLPLDQVAEGYKAMDERRAIKTLLTV